MNLTFLGKISENGQSPTLYATDRDTFVIQGWRVVDTEALAALDLPDHETVTDVPKALMRFLPAAAD